MAPQTLPRRLLFRLAGSLGLGVCLATAGPTSLAAQTPGARWTLLEPAGEVPRPRARRDHSLTYDAAAGLLYLFGGRSQGKETDELWAFNPQTSAWAEIAVDGPKPPARFGHSACYDPHRQQLLVTLGQAGPRFFDDVWTFDPATVSWRQLGAESAAAPRPRYGSGAAGDPAGDRLLITHGFTDEGRFDDTWAFDLAGEVWSQVPIAAPVPLKRCLLRAEWHFATGQLLLFGGQSDQQLFHGDLWSLDVAAGAWTERHPDPSPGPRNFYGAGLDGATGSWYVFGGNTPNGPSADVWAFDAAADGWSLFELPAPPEAPSARFSADVAPAPGGFYLFGGTTGRDELDDLWVLTLEATG